jgi:hypothetical protein
MNLNDTIVVRCLVLKCPVTFCGMKRWGLRSCEPITRQEPCQREIHLANHLTPNVL